MNSSIKIGIAGYGYWGPNLVRNFANTDGCQVKIVSDFDEAKLAACNRAYPTITTSTRYQDLLEESIDAVVIATPAKSHFELALMALRAGKHVLVEKPIAQTSDQVRRLLEEAERRKLTLMVDHTFLYTPAIQKIRQLVSDGALGQIYYYNGTRASLGLFQSDVNVIWDLAVHDISIIQYLFNEEPVAVSATGATHVAGGHENMAHVTLFFKESFVAHINVNWLSPVKVRQTFIGGSSKMIVYDDLEPDEKIKIYDKGITLNSTAENARQLRIGYRAGDMCAPHLPAAEALHTEARHFIDCIRHAKTPISSGQTGLGVTKILEAASRSILAKGRPIDLESDGASLGRVGANADMQFS